MALIWHVWVDWNNDGVYESDEASRLIAIPRIERGKSSLHDDPMVGMCELQLSNHDRRYDAWYSGAVMYPNIGVNRRIKVTVEIGATTYPIFVGRTAEPRSTGFRASGAQGGVRKMSLTAYDGWKIIQSRKVDIGLQQNITQADAITALLNAVGWVQAAGLWILDTGQLDSTTILGGMYGDNIDLGSQAGDTIPYWWIYSDENPSQNLIDLVRAHLGRIWIANDGTLKWRTVAQDNGAAVDLTLTDAMLQEMNIVYRLEDVRNKIIVRATPRSVASLGAVWTFNEQPQLQPGETREIWAEFTNTDGERVPAVNVVTTPVATTDYTANQNLDGSGTNYTANISVTVTAYSTNARVTVTNNASAPAYLTLLQLRGQAIDNLESSSLIEEDVASQETYGALDLDLDLRWQQKTLVAQDLADYALSAYKDPRPTLELRFQNSTTALIYDIGTKILDSTSLGTGGTYRLERIVHEIPDGMNCQVIYTTWTLYPIMPDDAWVLESAIQGQLGVSTILGF